MTRFPRYPVWSRGKSLHGWESCFHKNKRDCSTIPSSMGELRALDSSPRRSSRRYFSWLSRASISFWRTNFPLCREFHSLHHPFGILFHVRFSSPWSEAKRLLLYHSESDFRRILFWPTACREFLNYERTRRFLVLIFFSKGLNLAKIEEEEGKYDLFRN